ncbi:BnaCnng40050D [Brassica napus]|uniref:BnaCnng40050D protein n=1 Tax=Brassica napus TaxID=3708 RepID=A0A078JAF3_BRANA|nr:BnaCnng40050D [Brassica napus]
MMQVILVKYLMMMITLQPNLRLA